MVRPNPALPMFASAFGVRADCQDAPRLRAAVAAFGGSAEVRESLLKRAAVALLDFERSPAYLLPLLEAWCGSPVTEAAFFDHCRRLLWQSPLVPNFGVAVSRILLSWAPHALDWPSGYSPAEITRQLQVELAQRAKWGTASRSLERDFTAAEQSRDLPPSVREVLIQRVRSQIGVIVNDRFCRLLGGGPLLSEDSQAVDMLLDIDRLPVVQLETAAIVGILARLSESGCQPETINALVHYWCWALQRTPSCWNALRQITWSAAQWIWPDSSPVSGATVEPPGLDAMLLWQWWLHASSLTGLDSQIPRVAAQVWSAWERVRLEMTAPQSAHCDQHEMFAAARYSLEALSQHLWQATKIAASAEEVHRLGRQLGLYLESYSTRMALHRLMVTDTQPTRTGITAQPSGWLQGDELFLDPNPDDQAAQVGIKNRQPFSSDGIDWEAVVATEPLDKVPTAARIAPADWRALTRPVDFADLRALLPRNCAYLGLYDLPRCTDSPLPGRPVALLIVHSATGEIFLACRTSARGDVAGNVSIDTAGEFLLAFDRQVDQAFRRYCRQIPDDESSARQNLAIELATAFEDRQRSVNGCYGALIDEVCEAVEQQLAGHAASLGELDLVVCPRGMTATCALDFLGTRATLHERFRSISTSPGLRVLDRLFRRAHARPSPTGPVQIGIAGWEHPPRPQNGHKSSPMVRALMSYAEKKLIEPFARGDSPLAEVHLAAETPLASLHRTWRMLSRNDYLVVFGHGSRQPAGIRLADGVFPSADAPLESELERNRPEIPSVVFNCACFGGRISQELVRGDALNPILSDLGLTLLLTKDHLQHRVPTLAAGFIHQVPGISAGECVIDILHDRLALASEGGERSGFQLAACRQRRLQRCLLALDKTGCEQLLRGSVEEVARINPDLFLSIYCVASLQLMGVEPPL